MRFAIPQTAIRISLLRIMISNLKQNLPFEDVDGVNSLIVIKLFDHIAVYIENDINFQPIRIKVKHKVQPVCYLYTEWYINQNKTSTKQVEVQLSTK